MELFWWSVAVILFAVGLIGTVLPVFPGTIIILAGALLHRMMLGPEKSIGWGTDRRPGAVDCGVVCAGFSKRLLRRAIFWSHKVGNVRRAARSAASAFSSGIAGLFVGPVIGAVAGEFIAGKRMIDAGRAGWGSLLGNLGAMMGKLFIALVMITIFFLTVPSPL